MYTVENKVINKIYGHGRGWCFSTNDFSDLGTTAAVRQALVRLTSRGTIRRVARGLYDYPKTHHLLGKLPPDIHEAAKALARKYSLKIQPSGAQAANLLGLSQQVPSKVVYLTTGEARSFKIGKTEIVFKMVAPKYMELAGTDAGLLVHGLRHLGEKAIDEETFASTISQLSKSQQQLLFKKRSTTPLWIQALINKYFEGKQRG